MKKIKLLMLLGSTSLAGMGIIIPLMTSCNPVLSIDKIAISGKAGDTINQTINVKNAKGSVSYLYDADKFNEYGLSISNGKITGQLMKECTNNLLDFKVSDSKSTVDSPLKVNVTANDEAKSIDGHDWIGQTSGRVHLNLNMDHTAAIFDGLSFYGTNLVIPDLVKDTNNNYYCVNEVGFVGQASWYLNGVVTFPEHFDTIAPYTFHYCDSTTVIKFGGTKNILSYGIERWNSSSCIIPASVKYIGSQAFYGGGANNSIHIEWPSMQGHSVDKVNGLGIMENPNDTGTIYSPNANITYSDLGLPVGWTSAPIPA